MTTFTVIVLLIGLAYFLCWLIMTIYDHMG